MTSPTPDDLLALDVFDEPDGPRPGAAPGRKCRRHKWILIAHDSRPGIASGTVICDRCERPRDELIARRGRTNRSRGNAIEREVGRQLGLRRVGQFGGPDDLSGEMFAAQVKSGGAFPERLWSWLRAVPVNGGQTPLLVVTDAPGPGHRRRAVVVLDITDWVALHGPQQREESAE